MQKKHSRVPSCSLTSPAPLVDRLRGGRTVPADVWAFLLAWGAIAAVKGGWLVGGPL